jgi:hypothetical protein
MGNQQVSKSPPSGEANRELARFALGEGDFDTQYMANKFGLANARATRDELVKSQTPLLTYEPKLDGALTKRLHDHLNTIGAKIRPDLSSEQAQSWVSALIIALSDLPPHVATKATQRALHIPFQYPSEVEAKIRELADEHLARIAMAIRRMDAIKAAIAEALNPTHKAVEDKRPAEEREKALPDSEVHKLQRQGGMGLQVVKMGLTLGYVKPEQLLPADDPSITQPEE